MISPLIRVILWFLYLITGWVMSPDEGQEEYEETQAELKKYEDDVSESISPLLSDVLYIYC